jgi:hypothetical protein
MNDQNLKPFKPGQSGNPKGKPKGTISITTVLRKLIEKRMQINDPISKLPKNLKIKEIMALALIKKAVAGDVHALEVAMERLEGKPVQPVMQGEFNDREFRDEFFVVSGTGAAKQ